MVLLIVTPVIKAAIEEYTSIPGAEQDEELSKLARLQPGDSVEHDALIRLSRSLTAHAQVPQPDDRPKWSLDALLRGSFVYRPPPANKPEPSAEYKQLMQRLRAEEEQRQYERMLTATSSKNDFSKDFGSLPKRFVPGLSHGYSGHEPVDEATLKDVENQLTLIVNVLITVFASGFTIWYAARYWAVPSRLALSMTGSLAIAIAEVVVYMGYVRRKEEAKRLEKKKIERKQITETWEITSKAPEIAETSVIRHRKGKHR